jgi:hypothetical protein
MEFVFKGTCLPWVHYKFTFTMFFVSHTWVYRTALVPLMAPMCWPEYLDTFNNLSGVGKKNLLKM